MGSTVRRTLLYAIVMVLLVGMAYTLVARIGTTSVGIGGQRPHRARSRRARRPPCDAASTNSKL